MKAFRTAKRANQWVKLHYARQGQRMQLCVLVRYVSGRYVDVRVYRFDTMLHFCRRDTMQRIQGGK